MKLKRLLSLAVLCVAGWTGNAYAYEVGQNITPPLFKKNGLAKLVVTNQSTQRSIARQPILLEKFSTCLSTTLSLKVTMKYNFTL